MIAASAGHDAALFADIGKVALNRAAIGTDRDAARRDLARNRRALLAIARGILPAFDGEVAAHIGDHRVAGRHRALQRSVVAGIQRHHAGAGHVAVELLARRRHRLVVAVGGVGTDRRSSTAVGQSPLPLY